MGFPGSQSARLIRDSVTFLELHRQRAYLHPLFDFATYVVTSVETDGLPTTTTQVWLARHDCIVADPV